IELPLIAQEVFPGDVARMRIQEHDRPVLLFDTAGSPFDPGFFASKHVASGLGTPIDVGPRVQGAVQDVQHTLMCETTPDQFICSLASRRGGGEASEQISSSARLPPHHRVGKRRCCSAKELTTASAESNCSKSEKTRRTASCTASSGSSTILP